MKLLLVAHMNGEDTDLAQAFGDLGPQLAGYEVEFRLAVADGGYINFQKLRTSMESSNIKLLLYNDLEPGHPWSLGYNKAMADSHDADVVIFFDHLVTFPDNFIETAVRYANAGKAWAPFVWQPVFQRTTANEFGYWDAPNYRTLAVPGAAVVPDRYLSSAGPAADGFFSALMLGSSTPVILSYLYGVSRRSIITAAAASKAQWKFQVDVGIAPDIEYTLPAYTEITRHTIEAAQLRARDILDSTVPVTGTPDEVKCIVRDTLWELFWSGDLPVVSEVVVTNSGGTSYVDKGASVALPFSPEAGTEETFDGAIRSEATQRQEQYPTKTKGGYIVPGGRKRGNTYHAGTLQREGSQGGED